jgi:hypothetical protein
MSDLRGYINPFVPGGLTEQGQRDGMPPGVEIYVEDRRGRGYPSLLRSIRKGSVVVVAETFYLAPGAFRPQKRRRLMRERIEELQGAGAVISEWVTSWRSDKGHLPRMMVQAVERIAQSGRMRKGVNKGRPPKWKLTPHEKLVIETIWTSRRYGNDDERVVEVVKRTGKRLSRSWLRLHFGPTSGPRSTHMRASPASRQSR